MSVLYSIFIYFVILVQKEAHQELGPSGMSGALDGEIEGLLIFCCLFLASSRSCMCAETREHVLISLPVPGVAVQSPGFIPCLLSSK